YGSARLAALLLLGLAAGCGDATTSGTQYAWLMLGPDGERIARVITESDTCPALDVDGRPVAMQVRAAAAPPLFPVLTCEASISSAATRVAVADRLLPLPEAPITRIAVIGDTGCRLETGDPPQSCNEPAAWPFARVADSVADLLGFLTGDAAGAQAALGLGTGSGSGVARTLAEVAPQLIVHVGDYLYREDPCPTGDEGCAGSPYGYDWTTIEADFFAPAAPLFRAAPLALTRGNHESCSRAGYVWFRFLDPRPYDPQCSDYTDPYAIELGNLQLLMFDSSAANDKSVDPAQVALYRPQFAEVARLAGPRAFFVTHRPMWVFGHAGVQNGVEQLFTGNPTLEAASESQLPASVEMVLSGHVHLFEALSFDQPRAPQLVIGNSGTELDQAVTTPLAGLEIAGATVAVGETRDTFGFAVLDARDDGWSMTLRDVAGATQLGCTIVDRTLSCP
ncbi:metallophosphoesterase, partial [Candidatus Binatia bacterium]|nr:metallophosphoesterase [Candidatus Binatia bacterium]